MQNRKQHIDKTKYTQSEAYFSHSRNGCRLEFSVRLKLGIAKVTGANTLAIILTFEQHRRHVQIHAPQPAQVQICWEIEVIQIWKETLIPTVTSRHTASLKQSCSSQRFLSAEIVRVSFLSLEYNEEVECST